MISCHMAKFKSGFPSLDASTMVNDFLKFQKQIRMGRYQHNENKQINIIMKMLKIMKKEEHFPNKNW